MTPEKPLPLELEVTSALSPSLKISAFISVPGLISVSSKRSNSFIYLTGLTFNFEK